MSSTGRERAKSSPFWATALQSMKSGAASVVRGIYDVIRRSPSLAPYLWMGSGYRTGSVEHQSGLSIDIMVTADTNRTPTADELAAATQLLNWLIANAGLLRIRGIIFSRDSRRRPQLWGYSQPGRWRDGKPRGSISGDHVDHIHVNFMASASWPAALSGAVIGAAAPVKPATPAPAKPATPAVAKPKLVSTVSVAALKAARYADPPKAGTPVGQYADQVLTLETALAKTGWLRSQYVDGHYGSTTVGDGSSGYGGTTGFQRKHSGTAKPDGWLGAKELAKLFRLAGMNVRVTD